MRVLLKYTSILLLGFVICSKSSAQTIIDSKSELIGTWKFVARSDKNGNKVDTIRHSFGNEIAAGPLTAYRADGTYSKKFTVENTDNGKWQYDSNKKEIVHQLYYAKPYSAAAKYLIGKGHAKKDASGDYYEYITTKVIELTSNTLILSERYEQQSTYIKIQE
jgi:hypothetical protein